jgi:outer membrane protein OmpA-like peptidoglycan-associated protein
MKKIRKISSVYGAVLLTALMANASAQGVKLYPENKGPSAEEVATILANGLKARKRGVSLDPEAEAQIQAKATLQIEEAQEATALAMPIAFAFDSAKLLPQSVEQLKVVAQGIKLMEGAVVVQIEGHTDAQGKVNYNMRLSQRRAEAVRKFFIEQHGLDVQLLKAQGKGSSEPLNKQNPFASENRRVQFRAG